MNTRIIQIATPAVPLFAVYREEQDTKKGLYIVPCPVVALVEEKRVQLVRGLVIEDWGLDVPTEDSNFLGYAYSKKDAETQYGHLAKKKA